MTQTPPSRLLVISRPDKSGHPLQRGIKKKRDARFRLRDKKEHTSFPPKLPTPQFKENLLFSSGGAIFRVPEN